MTNIRASITINKEIKEVVEEILTPESLLNIPKGALSSLMSSLLIKFIEDFYKKDLDEILDQHKQGLTFKDKKVKNNVN